jgi:hypothetical protein
MSPIEQRGPNAADEPPPDLAARARAWRATRDPRALWPGVDPATLPPAAATIERAVSAALRDEHATPLAGDARDARAIGIAALVTGTGPLLGAWIERGTLDASPPVAEVLARHLAHGRRRVTRIVDGVRPALQALHAVGIVPAVMKGIHTAHAYFDEPGLRPIADVDVFVAPHEIARAEGALRAAGFTPSADVEHGFSAAPDGATSYKRDWYPPDDDGRLWSLELWDARDRWKLELHDGVGFAFLRRYGVHLDDAQPVDETWNGLGALVRVPPPPLLLAILATHASGELHHARLLRLVELTLVIRRERARGRLDWHAVEALLAHAGALRFVYPALRLTERLAPGTIDARFLDRARRATTRLARRVAERFTPTAPLLEERVSLAERLMWESGPRELLARIADVTHVRARRLLGGSG